MILYENREEIYRLIYYLLDNGYRWHLEYAQSVLIPSEVHKLMTEREKFNKGILERADKLLNPKEDRDIDNIIILTEGSKIELNSIDYSSGNLANIKEQLESSMPIDVKGDCKYIYINEYKGYEITYVSDYKGTMHKQNTKDLDLD